ncbi:hypothetical protein B0T11DRAFT_103328 [Plectosphaerella cucumerina]|uniref:Uncharacterized protein n=1 Tax=Plectosphaerella cucumerina TaxID=40658 RepID=A0A8K0X1M9_9PEZI|nr:hypothetical protein B0T11DRAFT_103328 [Plectosphaerella cucumerina]
MFSARATPESTSFFNGRRRHWPPSAEIPRCQTTSGRISNSHQLTCLRPGITPGPNPLGYHSLVEEEPSRASTSGANATISPQRFHSPVDQRRIGRCRASAHHSSAFEGPHLPPSLLSPCPASAGTVSAIARRRSLPPLPRHWRRRGVRSLRANHSKLLLGRLGFFSGTHDMTSFLTTASVDPVGALAGLLRWGPVAGLSWTRGRGE